MTRFKPIDFPRSGFHLGHESEIAYRCLNGTHLDIRISGFDMPNFFLFDIPLDEFKENISALENGLIIKPKSPTYRMLEWNAYEGLTIRRPGFLVCFDCDLNTLQGFLDDANEFLEILQEHINAVA